MLKKTKIILAIVLPIVLVVGGGGFYYAAFHPMRENVQEKPIVKLPTRYEGNISIFPFLGPYSYDSKTPLKKYWLREYFKDYLEGYRVNETVDNITLTINNTWFSGYPGWEQHLAFNVTLKSSTYIEKAIFISNATYIYELGNFPTAYLSYPPEYSKYIVKRVDVPQYYYDLVVFKFEKSNVSIQATDFVDIDGGDVNKTVPYYFTAYIETKDKIYEMNFVFNLTDEWEPYLDLQDLYYMGNYSFYIPGSKYFCYTPYGKSKVVISNHIVPGTKYFFAEKDGVLSAITRYLPEQKYVKKNFYVNKLFYFTPKELNATILNSTPLAKYWEKEYLKSHEWEMNAGGISIEVYPIYFLGYNGTFLGYNTTKGQFILNSIVNSTKYVGNITYTLNALKAIPLNGAYFDTAVAPQGNPLNNGAHYKRVYRNYMEDWQEVKYAFNTENFTFSSQLYLNISYWTASEIPYSVTITVEQKDYYYDILENVTYYTLQIHFNLAREQYPFLNPNTTGHNVTYFCYNSSWGKVVISDHLVAGTQYYFVEKNGVLSRIWSPYEVRNGW